MELECGLLSLVSDVARSYLFDCIPLRSFEDNKGRRNTKRRWVVGLSRDHACARGLDATCTLLVPVDLILGLYKVDVVN